MTAVLRFSVRTNTHPAATSPIKHLAHTLQRTYFSSQLADQHWNKQDHGDLSNLRRLQLLSERQSDPSSGPVYLDTQRRLHQRHHHDCYKIYSPGPFDIVMIINPGNHIHTDKSHNAKENLPLEIIHTVTVIHQCTVGTGTIQHDQTKADQKDQDSQQTIVKINGFVRPFSFYTFGFTHLITLPSYIFNQI